MEYNVTDRGSYEEITLTGWGEATNLDAVHAFYGDQLQAVILEPEDRKNPALWDDDAEWRFRDDVQRFISGWEDVPDTLVYDPGRDNQSSVAREDFGY